MIACTCGHGYHAHDETQRAAGLWPWPCVAVGCDCRAFTPDPTDQRARLMCTTHDGCQLLALADYVENNVGTSGRLRPGSLRALWDLAHGVAVVPCRSLGEIFCPCGEPLVLGRFVNGRRMGRCVRREAFEGMLDNRDQHPELMLPDRPLS